jgi:hypothetical protein
MEGARRGLTRRRLSHPLSVGQLPDSADGWRRLASRWRPCRSAIPGAVATCDAGEGMGSDRESQQEVTDRR